MSDQKQSSRYYSIPSDNKSPRAVYIHVPFCLHRCGYCDFTLVAQQDDLIPGYLEAIANELSQVDRVYEVDSIFIGGGTPTHLSTEQLEQLIGHVRSRFSLSEDGEFSSEANPDGLDDARLDVLSGLGVNRLSLGVQSFHTDMLSILERQHSREHALRSIERAASYIPNLSVDLIFGVPKQTISIWQESLETAVRLPVTHISTYGLTFEKGTDFFRRQQHGDLVSVPDELEREMYSTAMSQLKDDGFSHYEISNFAKPGFECIHNNVYWDASEYFAFGPGAARYLNGTRSTNARSVSRWLKNWLENKSAIQEEETLDHESRIREAVFLGLRRTDGICQAEFARRFGCGIAEIEPHGVERNIANGLLEIVDDHIRLTPDGRFVADSVVSDFLAATD